MTTAYTHTLQFDVTTTWVDIRSGTAWTITWFQREKYRGNKQVNRVPIVMQEITLSPSFSIKYEKYGAVIRYLAVCCWNQFLQRFSLTTKLLLLILFRYTSLITGPNKRKTMPAYYISIQTSVFTPSFLFYVQPFQFESLISIWVVAAVKSLFHCLHFFIGFTNFFGSFFRKCQYKRQSESLDALLAHKRDYLFGVCNFSIWDLYAECFREHQA